MLPRAANAIPSLATAAASLLWRTCAGWRVEDTFLFFQFLELQTCLKTPSSAVPLAARKCWHQVLRSVPMLHETQVDMICSQFRYALKSSSELSPLPRCPNSIEIKRWHPGLSKQSTPVESHHSGLSETGVSDTGFSQSKMQKKTNPKSKLQNPDQKSWSDDFL